jgi:hypothetical protein
MVRGFPELFYEERKEDLLEFPANGTSLDLLQAIYRNPEMPLHTRMRAASMCLPHEHPRLGITFQTTNETDFARLLDERIARHQSKVIEPPQIEHQPHAVEVRPALARTGDRRFRRL